MVMDVKPPQKTFPAMIYAAGYGTRMLPLTKNLPKPLVNVADRTLLDRAIDVLDVPSVSSIVINTHYLYELIEAHPTDRYVQFSREVELKDTGGGLKHALRLLNGNPVITLNSDAVWSGENPVDFLTRHWTLEMGGLLLLVQKDKAIGHTGDGDFDINVENRISKGTSTIFTGLQIIRTDLFERQGDDVFSTHVVWDQMLKSGQLFGLIYPGSWCDVGWPGAIPLAEALLESA